MNLNLVRKFRSPNLHGYNVKFSPFKENIIALVGGENYGLKGKGALYIYDLSSKSHLPSINYSWSDCLFDISFSEENENILITCSGNSTLQIWDLSVPSNKQPVRVIPAHDIEVSSVEWFLTSGSKLFVTSSWDRTIKVWDFERAESVCMFSGHTKLVYQASTSPYLENCIASVSGDGFVMLWDYRIASQAPVAQFKAHIGEVLCCDWSKYTSQLLLTGGTDYFVRGWDIRNTTAPVLNFEGHENPVRKVKCSPFSPDEFASVAYDFTTRVWTSKKNIVRKEHSEFVYGLDYSRIKESLIVDSSWDESINLYHHLTDNADTR